MEMRAPQDQEKEVKTYSEYAQQTMQEKILA